jgi:hypothetical protein
MDIRISPILAACCLVFLQSAAADIITLSDGKKIKGTVIREDGDDYIVEVVISGTIRDERRIARADVSHIDKKPDYEKAFDEIGVPVPTPDLADAEAYEEWLSKLEDFIKAYPESPKAQDAKEMFDTLGSEHDIIAAGGIKFGGEMVSADDYDSNAYEYDQKIAEKRIKDAVARRDFLGSLRMYSNYSERFGQTEGGNAMDALVLQVLIAYKASLDENLASLDRRLEKRKSGLASMTPEDRSQTERALQEEMEKIQQRYQKEKAAGQKWVTPESFHKESMEEVRRAVETEMVRLRSLPTAPQLDMPLAETYRVAWDRLSDVLAKEESMISEVPAKEEDGKPADENVEERKLAVLAQDERKKAMQEGKRKILAEAKASHLTEFYLEKLRSRAGLEEQ